MLNPHPTLPIPFSTDLANLSPLPTHVIKHRGVLAPILIVLVSVLAASALLVHLVVVPLQVAVVWFQPATLLIESQPAGAEVVVDGKKLDLLTPTRAAIRRDLGVHAVDLRKPGYRSVSHPVRYDSEVDLKLAVTLEPEPTPKP